MLLTLFLNNIPICLEGTLKCICTRISIKAYVFIQKSMYHNQNHVQISMWNCSFQDKRVNSTFNAHRNNFLANKTVRLVSGLYVLIDARNKISRLFIALWKTWMERDVSLLEAKSCKCWLMSSLMETESLSDTKVSTLRQVSDIMETWFKWLKSACPSALYISFEFHSNSFTIRRPKKELNCNYCLYQKWENSIR